MVVLSEWRVMSSDLLYQKFDSLFAVHSSTSVAKPTDLLRRRMLDIVQVKIFRNAVTK